MDTSPNWRYSVPGMMRFPEVEALMDEMEPLWAVMPWIGGIYEKFPTFVRVIWWSGLDPKVDYVHHVLLDEHIREMPMHKARTRLGAFNRLYVRAEWLE